MKRLFCFSLVLLTIASCSDKTNREETFYQLIKEEKALLCELSMMRDSISATWDNVSNMLDQNLPENMPEEEKNNMLNARNGSLIRMFESFENVNDDVKMTLTKAEHYDSEMAKKIMIMKEEKQQIESSIMALLKETKELKGTEGYNQLKTAYQNKLNEECI